MTQPDESGYAPVNGMDMYWESRGTGGTPLIVTHGGFGLTTMFGDLPSRLARDRQVISIELRGHGRTKDTGQPFGFAEFGDDIAAHAGHLGLGQVDLFGLSLGAGASLRTTIQHPDLVRRLAVMSFPCRRDGWLPEVLAGMDQLDRSAFAMHSRSPMYEEWKAVAADVDSYPTLLDKVGDLLRTPYDWSAEVQRITAPTPLVFADADSISITHVAEFFGLLGGGRQDGNFDGTSPTPMRLAVLPGMTHYSIHAAPQLPTLLADFLS